MASVIEVVENVFPRHIRLKARKIARKVFKMPLEKVLYLWKYLSDPLRGSIVQAGNEFIVIKHLPEYYNLVHVSDIVKYVLHGAVEDQKVLNEKQIRLMVKGLYYHKLLPRLIDPDKKVIFEFPIVLDLDEVVTIGNIDSIIVHDNKYIIVEHKSSDTARTIRYGLVQVRLYWSILDELLPGKIMGAVLLTPTQAFELDRPLSRRELKGVVIPTFNHLLTSYTTMATTFTDIPL